MGIKPPPILVGSTNIAMAVALAMATVMEEEEWDDPRAPFEV